MSRDDDDTGKRQRPGSMSDAARALIGRRARRSATYTVPAIPEPRDPNEITNPYDMLERDLRQTELDVIKRSKRDSDSPVIFADIVKLAEDIYKDRSETREREAQYAAVLKSPHEVAERLAARLTAVEELIKGVRRIAIAAIITLGGGVGTFATGVLNRHDEATTDRIHLEQLLKDSARLDDEIRDFRIQLGRSSQLHRSTSATFAEKGTIQ